MGKRKKKLGEKPWYCDREFEDEKVLIVHQKAKHFKCSHCNKRLFTIGGLVIHVQQVHKEILSTVPNALENRNNIDIEIFGMEGVPENDIMARLNELKGKQYNKKPRTDMHQDASELQRQLAAFKEKREAQTVNSSVASYATPQLNASAALQYSQPQPYYPPPYAPPPFAFAPPPQFRPPPPMMAARPPPMQPLYAARPPAPHFAPLHQAPGLPPLPPPVQAPAPTSLEKESRLVYEDSVYSVEERRAMVGKYRA